MRKAWLLFALMVLPFRVAAQTGVVQSHCFLGGKKAITSGTNSTNFMDGIIPACTVTVYQHGTTNKAIIYTEDGGPLANPFTANDAAPTTVDPGGWVFRAAINQGLDIMFSGGNSNPNCTTQPNCYAHPVTLLIDIFPSQSVTPIINPMEVQTNEVDNFNQLLLDFKDTATVKFTNPSGGIEQATVPDATNSSLGVAQCDGVTTTCSSGVITANPGVSIQTNGTPNTSQTVLNHVDTQSVKWSNPSGGIEEATADLSGALEMESTPPTTGTWIKVFPSGVTYSGAVNYFLGAGNLVGGIAQSTGCGLGGCIGGGPAYVTWTFTLPSYVNPSNVTQVWASSTNRTYQIGNNSGFATQGSFTCQKSGGANHQLAVLYAYDPALPLVQRDVQMGDTGGSDVNTVTCTASLGAVDPIQAGMGINIASIFLQLQDTVDTAPPDKAIRILPPMCLGADAANNTTLGLCFPIDVESDFGTTNAIVITDSNLKNIAGNHFWFFPAHTSTSTTPTLQLNSTTPVVTILGPTGGALSVGDLNSSNPSLVIFDGTNWRLQNPQVSGGGGGSISGQTAGYAIKAATATTATAPFPLDDSVTTANTVTVHKVFAINDGTGVAGTNYLQQGTGASNIANNVALTVPSSVTAYRIMLPGVAPTSGNTFLSCTAADPAVCTWAASGGGGGGSPGGLSGEIQYNNSSAFGGMSGVTYPGTAGMLAAASTDAHTGAATANYVVSNINALNIQTEFRAQQNGGDAVNAVTGADLIGSGANIHQANALAGFIDNSSTATNAVGVYSQALCSANSTNCWGSNPLVASVTGHTNIELRGTEVNVNVNNTTDFGEGIDVIGAWSAQSTNMNGIFVEQPVASSGGPYHWSTAFFSGGGAATQGMVLGALQSSGTSIASQPIWLQNRDSGGTVRDTIMQADTAGNLVLTPFSTVTKATGDLIVTNITSSTSPICPNGTGGAFTTSGCSGGGGTGLSGMTAGQVPIAATSSTVTSSKAILGTDTSLVSGAGTFTTSTIAIGTANGGVTNATAIPNGITATTQSAASNDTKVATDAYVDGHFIASGTSAMGTSAISSGTCASVVTTAATGVATTDVIVYTPNVDPTGVTGYAVSATGSLYIWAYPTSGNVNFKVCNNTSGSLTPSALTLNWKVTR